MKGSRPVRIVPCPVPFPPQHFFKVHRHQFPGPDPHHLSGLTLQDQLNRPGPHTAGQQTVHDGGSTAALQVSQDRHPDIIAGALPDLLADLDAAPRPLGNDDNTMQLAPVDAPFQFENNLIDIVGYLRDQDRFRPPASPATRAIWPDL